MENWEKIKEIYLKITPLIESRLNEFKKISKQGSDKDIFKELIFCLLTPQSKAKVCWTAVENMDSKGILLKGDKKQILKELKGVRFKSLKTDYIIKARKMFFKNSFKKMIKKFNNASQLREWLARHVKGMGYKEASHFLRNIGMGENFAILDRHILKNLKLLGVIENIPNTLSWKKYMEIEKRMQEFSKKINLPMSHLDLLLWYKETGEVFK